MIDTIKKYLHDAGVGLRALAGYDVKNASYVMTMKISIIKHVSGDMTW